MAGNFAGDAGKITVGNQTNIQDGTVIRTGPASVEEEAADTSIGAKVTIGHQASLHGCTIEDEALIGMGAILMQGSKVERGSMVAAGAVVMPGTTIPAGEIWGGNPARYLRSLKPEESKFLTGKKSSFLIYMYKAYNMPTFHLTIYIVPVQLQSLLIIT